MYLDQKSSAIFGTAFLFQGYLDILHLLQLTIYVS